MKKQFKMIVLASLLVLVMQLVGCGEVELTIKPNPATTIELGSEMSQDVNDYMTVTVGGKEVQNQEGIVVDTSQVDTTKVGMYMLNIIYEDHLSILNVAVIDSTPPELSVTDTKIAIGTAISANEVASANDYSESGVAFLVDGEYVLELTITETVDATVSAMDEYGNETTKTVHIEAFAADAEAPVVSANDISAVD